MMDNKYEEKFRLITRSDFDGIASAVLLKSIGLVKELKFVHPKDVQDGVVQVTRNDITTNLPYTESAHYAFDHHSSEVKRVGANKHNYIIDPSAPSATRVVWNMFGGKKSFPNIDEAFIDAVDKSDSADFTIEEILDPQGWVLLSFIMDARTGLGRFHDYRISNFQLMMDLVDLCMSMDPEKILNHPDVKERVDILNKYKSKFRKQLKDCTAVHKNVAYIDLLNQEQIYPGNRFMIYALFPDCNVSIHHMWRTINKVGVYAVGRSIFNKTNRVNIGELMLKYGGGGHRQSGTCQVRADKMRVIGQDMIQILTTPEYNLSE